MTLSTNNRFEISLAEQLLNNANNLLQKTSTVLQNNIQNLNKNNAINNNNDIDNNNIENNIESNLSAAQNLKIENAKENLENIIECAHIATVSFDENNLNET
jgi:hypothetical protein